MLIFRACLLVLWEVACGGDDMGEAVEIIDTVSLLVEWYELGSFFFEIRNDLQTRVKKATISEFAYLPQFDRLQTCRPMGGE